MFSLIPGREHRSFKANYGLMEKLSKKDLLKKVEHSINNIISIIKTILTIHIITCVLHISQHLHPVAGIPTLSEYIMKFLKSSSCWHTELF